MTTNSQHQAETRFVELMTELFQLDEAQALDFCRYPAERVYTNNPAALSFEGCDQFESIESVFALQFGRG